MNSSIGIRINKNSQIDCGVLCKNIQQLISQNIQDQQNFEKILLISIKDIIETSEPLKRLEHKI